MRGIAIWALSVLLLCPALGAESATQSPLDAGAALTSIRDKGASSVLSELVKTETKWKSVLMGVASGDPLWLKVAAGLGPGAGGHTAEELLNAVSLALPKSPAIVLAMTGKTYPLDKVCSLPPLEHDLGPLYIHHDNGVAALRALTTPELTAKRDQCLSVLEAAFNDMVATTDE